MATRTVFTTGEAAKLCKVSQQTIIRCFDGGQLKGFRVPGSRFRRIPREQLYAFMKENGIPTAALESEKRRVLIVDDDEQLVELLGNTYEDDGRFEVRTATSGFDAGMLIKDFRPDLVILDVLLPDIDGQVVCERIRRDHSLESVKVICISGLVNEERVANLQAAGANLFLRKPFESHHLLNRSCDLLEIERQAEEWGDSRMSAYDSGSTQQTAVASRGHLVHQYVAVELTIDGDFNSFTEAHLNTFLNELRSLLGPSEELSLVRAERGSIKITIELTREQAERLLALHGRGMLDVLSVIDASVIRGSVAAAIVDGKSETGEYDVFMCHNNNDKPEVKRIAKRLLNNGVLPWLDEWELRPGVPWQRALEKQIATIRSAAVFVGNSGLGPWQNMELEGFIRQFVQRQCPVIPVLLRSCPCQPDIPQFLAGMTWVNFKKRKPDPAQHLIWGITGAREEAGITRR